MALMQWGQKHILAACDASLARLGTDYIDLYQIHWHSAAALRTEKYPDRPLLEALVNVGVGDVPIKSA